jgi:hypothetical protein
MSENRVLRALIDSDSHSRDPPPRHLQPVTSFFQPERAQASTNVIPIRTWRHMLSTRLARLSGKQIGEACQCDHTQASRIASGQRGATMDEWCALLEMMGLKVVDENKVCISPDRLHLARQTEVLGTDDLPRAGKRADRASPVGVAGVIVSFFSTGSAVTARLASRQTSKVRDLWASEAAARKSQKSLTGDRTIVLCLTFKSRVEAMRRA